MLKVKHIFNKLNQLKLVIIYNINGTLQLENAGINAKNNVNINYGDTLDAKDPCNV